MKKIALIVAGGSGTRMNNALPKQFIELATKPILQHTIEKFYAYDSSINIYVVLPKKEMEHWENLCITNNFTITHHIITGGNSRFQSVRNGLNAIQKEEAIVFIHDGVRPLVNVSVLNDCYNTAMQYGNAIPTINLVDTVRQVNETNSISLPRHELKAVQTPQTFLLSEIKEAYLSKESDLFTDDASVYQALNKKIKLVNGNIENIKITSPIDLIIATHYLSLNK